MNKKFIWASNLIKLQRAIANTKSEEDSIVKEEYIRLGGLVVEDMVQPTPEEVVSEIVDSTEEAIEAIEEAKPKRTRIKKDVK